MGKELNGASGGGTVHDNWPASGAPVSPAPAPASTLAGAPASVAPAGRVDVGDAAGRHAHAETATQKAPTTRATIIARMFARAPFPTMYASELNAGAEDARRHGC